VVFGVPLATFAPRGVALGPPSLPAPPPTIDRAEDAFRDVGWLE